MGVKIKKFKRIFEDDALNNGQQPALNVLNNGQQADPNALNNNQNNGDQNAQQNNQNGGDQQQLQPNPNAEKVLQILGDGKDTTGKNMSNAYWVMSVNLPEEILKLIPDFKLGNQLADPAIKSWEAFKNAPAEGTYNQFVTDFKNFGGQGQQEGDANNQNGNNATTQQANNVNASYKSEYQFRKNLMENLSVAKKLKYYNSISEDYFDRTSFSL